MIRKRYQTPAIQVVQLQHRYHLLTLSNLETNGLKSDEADAPDLIYDKNGADQSDAW